MSLRSKIIAHTNGNMLFWAILGAIVVMASLYVYAVNKTVVLVAERNAIESKITATKAQVAGLQSQYIASKSQITMDLAQSLGYTQAEKVVYMPKKSVSLLARAVE